MSSCKILWLYYVSIFSRFVSFSSCSPELALVSVSILFLVSHSVRVSREMLSAITADHVRVFLLMLILLLLSCSFYSSFLLLFFLVLILLSPPCHLRPPPLSLPRPRPPPPLSPPPPPPPSSSSPPTQEASVAIVHGFIEHLEWEESGAGAGGGAREEGEGGGVAALRKELKLNILKLLVFCIDRPSPNIAHLLLGFYLGKKMETTLQDPGVCLIHVHACIHTCTYIHTYIHTVPYMQKFSWVKYFEG